MAETYTRLPVPADYDPAYFSTALATIQRVLAGLTVSGIASATAPIHYDAPTQVVSHDVSGVSASTVGDATHVARVTTDVFGHITGLSSVAITGVGGTTVQAGRLTGDVSTSGGSYVTGFGTFPVLTGESWSFRWVLFLGTSVGASGGISFQVVHATSTAGRGISVGIRGGALFPQGVSSASPIVFPTAYANADFSASDTWVVIDASIYNLTADGTVDLQFKNAGGGETAILRPASTFTAVKTG